jgi:hypothetical protein
MGGGEFASPIRPSYHSDYAQFRTRGLKKAGQAPNGTKALSDASAPDNEDASHFPNPVEMSHR